MQPNKTEKLPVGKSEAEKILSSVPFEQGFHFATDLGKYTGETAINLFSFYEELRTIGPQSVKFHFQRRDFGGLHGTGFKVAHEAGKDLTEAIKSAPHGEEVFSKVKQVGVLVQSKNASKFPVLASQK